jgi:2-(1,2-epoxy-1,2-dihydrophenyl)acetyl-CoA isomerase
MATEFGRAVDKVLAMDDIRAIILSGAGPAFAVGGDLRYFHAAGDDAQLAARLLIEPMHAAMLRLADGAPVTIAAVHGAVAGAGMSLMMACDLAVADETASFNMAYLGVEASPDCSGSWHLPRIVGLRRACEIALLVERLSAADAHRFGLINRLVPAGGAVAAAKEMAKRIAAHSPIALANTRRLLRQSHQVSLAQQLHDESEAFAECAGSDDFRAAMGRFIKSAQRKSDAR